MVGACVHSGLMAIADALLTVLQDWAAIEPRLSDQQLNYVARLSLTPRNPGFYGPAWLLRDDELRHSQGLGLEDLLEPTGTGPSYELYELVAANLFATVALALGPDHRAWSALRESPTRLSTGQQPRASDLVHLFGERAESAMSSREASEDARADLLEEAVRRSVLRFGYTVIDIEQANESRAVEAPLIIVELNGQFAVPHFQLQSDSDTQRIVEEVNTVLEAWADPLGAASWWLSPNGWLGNVPAALLDTAREGEIVFAAEQLTSDSW